MKAIHPVFFFIFLISTSSALADELLPEKAIMFDTVADALTFLKTKPSVSFTTTQPDGWIIANDSSPFSVWSFVPQVHYAYPAVIKRELVQNEKGGVHIKMTALCQAEKKLCDKLISEFEEMNNKSAKNIQKKITE